MSSKKSKFSSVGGNLHPQIDNIITLFRSSNDCFDGALDYIFYRVLNCTPIEYNNISKNSHVYDDDELNEAEKNFIFYSSKRKDFSETLQNDLIKIIHLIREDALEEGIIVKVFNNKFQETGNSYNFDYLLKKIFLYYKNNGRG